MTEKLPSFLIYSWIAEPLEKKIERSKIRIKQFYDKLDGQVYISTSGGKDSTVLLHLVRSLYPEVKAVNVAVPMYPETRRFLKTVDNLEVLIPKKTYQEVVERWGYPVVSKEVSKNISRYIKGDEDTKRYRMYGIKKNGSTGKVGVIPKKWRFMIDAPFKISDECCNQLKKHPLTKYGKKTGTRPFIGILATESHRRMRDFREKGCNIFVRGKEKGMPLSAWTERDIWDYIKLNKLPYSPVYDMGETRTGCLGCLFGCHREKEPNRFQRLYYQHPKIYKYYIDDMGLGKIMDFMGLNYHPFEPPATQTTLSSFQ